MYLYAQSVKQLYCAQLARNIHVVSTFKSQFDFIFMHCEHAPNSVRDSFL